MSNLLLVVFNFRLAKAANSFQSRFVKAVNCKSGISANNFVLKILSILFTLITVLNKIHIILFNKAFKLIIFTIFAQS